MCRKFKLNLTIRKKILISTSLFIFISVMLVSFFSSKNYKKDLIKLSENNNQITIEQLKYNIEIYIQDLQSLCISPYYNNQVMQSLSMNPISSSEILQKQRILENFLQENMIIPRTEIEASYFITSSGTYSAKKTQTFLSQDNQQNFSYEKVKNSNIPIVFVSEGEKEIISIISNIKDFSDNTKSVGILRIDINTSELDKICQKVLSNEGKSILLIDDKQNIIFGRGIDFTTEEVKKIIENISSNDNKKTIYSIRNSNFMFISQKISTLNWTIIDINNLDVLFEGANNNQKISILMGILFAGFGILITTQLITQLLKPIYKVTNLMKTVKGENLSIKAPVNGNDEIAFLSTAFNEMTQKIDSTMKKNIELTKQIYEARYLEKEAQYVALCNQIEPHFLFNSLNTISLLIKTEKNNDAILYIEKLASLLNAQVHADSEITLRRELLVCKNYLELQKIRLSKLQFNIDFNKEALDGSVPSLILQPIIENAIKHGMATVINIKITLEKNMIKIFVEDNGIGISESTLKKLKEETENPESAFAKNKKGIALVNIARRIKLKYGKEYGITIFSEENKGSSFCLILPFEKKEERFV